MAAYTYTRFSAKKALIEIQVGNNRIGHSIDTAHEAITPNDLERLGISDADLDELNMSKGEMVAQINSEGAKRSSAHSLVLQDFDQSGLRIQEFANIMESNPNTPLLEYLNLYHPNHPYL